MNVAPYLSISGEAIVAEGSQYTLNLSVDDPGADTIAGWEIDWGDGHIDEIENNPSSVTHYYADGPDNYTITATADDDDGADWPVGGVAGALDNSFGTEGNVLTAFSTGVGADYGQAMTINGDGKIIVVGYSDSRDMELVCYNAVGTLDTNFGDGGRVILDLGGLDRPQAVAVQSDGKIVVAGYILVSGSGNYDFVLARYNIDGTLDLSFSDGGRMITDFGSTDSGRSIAIQNDDKILVAGYAWISGQGYNFALARYTADGRLDPSFGDDGKLTTDFDGGTDYARAVVVQSDDKILVVGQAYNGSNYDFALARYDEDGSLDTSFGTDGMVTTPIDNGDDMAYAVAIHSDKIIVAGRSHNGSNYDFALARYNRSNGSLDTSFETNGKYTFAIGAGHDDAFAMTVDSNGDILVAGRSHNGSNYDFAVACYDVSENGLSGTFGTGGKTTFSFGSGNDEAYAMVLLEGDDQLLVAGEALTSYSYDFAVARLIYDGVDDGDLDTSFGSGGKVTTDFPGADSLHGTVVQADQKIVAAGYAYVDGDYDFTLSRYNSDGTLDTTFAGDGKQITDFDTDSADYAYDVAMQPDQKIVVVGRVAGDFGVARYTTAGELDTSFSGDGLKETNVSGTDSARAVVVQSDNKIVVAGFSYVSGNYDFSVARYDDDGDLDTSFSGDGKVTTPIGAGSDYAFAVALQTIGEEEKILVAGRTHNGSNYDFALVRYNADGSLDTTNFGVNGIAEIDFGSGNDVIYDIAVLENGKIVVAGYARDSGLDKFAVARFDTNGTLDTSFGDGDDGHTLITIASGYHSYGRAVEIQSDGKILVSGYSNSGHTDFAIVRYEDDGDLDTTFDGDGIVTTDFNRSAELGRAMALQADDRIVVAGLGHYDFQLVRYLPGNVPDNVSVTNVAPTLTLGGDSVVGEGAPYTLTLGTVDDPGQDTVQKYVIDWGDGQQSTYTAAEIADLNRQVTHVYTHGPSSPTISVNLIDEDGRYVGVSNKAVTVEDAAPNFAPGNTNQVGYVGYHDNGDPITFPIVVADPADDLTYELSDLPEEMAGSTIDANGIFRWTPAASDAGETYTFDVTVTNQSELYITDTFTLAVQSFFTSASEIALSTVRPDAVRAAWPNCTEGQFQISLTGETPTSSQLVLGSGGIQDGWLMISAEGYLSWSPSIDCREETYHITVTYTHPGDQPVTKDITLNLANEDLRPAFFIDRPDPVYDDIHEQHWHGHDVDYCNYSPDIVIPQFPGVYERQLQLPRAYDREGAVAYELIADPDPEKDEHLPQDAEISPNGVLTCKFTSPDDAYQVYQFNMKATDSTGKIDVRHVVLGVHVLYQGHIATQIATNTYAAVEENSGVNRISVMGYGSELMSYCSGMLYIDAQPAHGTLQLDPDYLGCVLYTPSQDYRGLDTFAYHWRYKKLDYWHPYTLPPLGWAETNVSRQQIQVGNWVDLEPDEQLGVYSTVLAVGGKTTATLTLQNPRADGVSTPGFWELSFNPDLIHVYDAAGKEILPPPSSWPGDTFLETVADEKEITLTVVGVSAGDATLLATWNAWGGEHDSTLYPDVALFDGWHWITTESVDFAVVDVDLDTDSDNDGDVDRTDAEDADEDVAGSGVGQVGKRIFVNKDDDNKNGKVDSSDLKSAYTAPTPDLTDNDFAQIMLDMAGIDLDDLAGYRLYLIGDEGLNIWADTKKTPLADATNPPGGSSGTDHDETDDVYWWTIGTDTFLGEGEESRTFWGEGTATGEREIRWQLRKSDGTTIIARDTVEINVEKIVWPNQDPSVDWNPAEPTSEWNGFELADDWFISSSLCNIINGTIGYIRTEYPEKISPDRWEGTGNQNSYAELDLAKLCGTANWENGATVRIELTYEFEQSPNITVGDFVDTNLENRWQASFFHNSGVKIENRAEIQIFDTAALLDAIDGSQETLDGNVVTMVGDENEINTQGYVKLHYGNPAVYSTVVHPSDYVKCLISGIPYNFINQLPDEMDDYMEWLQSAPMGGQTMTIDVFRESDGEYTFVVTIGEGTPKRYENVPASGTATPGKLYLQSHWGSGVKFTSAKVKKL